MAHIKVWTGTLLTAVLAFLLWQIPPQLNQAANRTKQQLEPYTHAISFQQLLRAFVEKQQKDIQRISKHPQLQSVLHQLNQKLPDRRGRKHRQAHLALREKFTMLREAKQTKRAFVFSTKQTLLFRSDQPEIYPPTNTGYTHTLLLSTLQKGQTSHALLHRGDDVVLVFGSPIRDTQSKVVGSLLLSIKIDDSFFSEIGFDPEGQKNYFVVLLNREKPLGFGTPQSMQTTVRQWVTKNYLVLSQKLGQGFVTSPPLQFHKQSYSYLVGNFQAPITNIQFGYALFAKLPAPTLVHFRGLSLHWYWGIIMFLAWVLALWFSLSAIFAKRTFKNLLANMAHDPSQIRLLEQIPSVYQFTSRHLSDLLIKADTPPPPGPRSYVLPAAQTTHKSAVSTPRIKTSPSPTTPHEPESRPSISYSPLKAHLQDRPSLTSLPPGLMGSDSEEGLEAQDTEKQNSFAPSAPLIPDLSDTPLPTKNQKAASKVADELADELDMAFTNIQDEPIKTAPQNVQTNQTEHKFKLLFQNYIEMRNRCGEPVHNVEYSQFVGRLHKQKKHIMNQFNCTDVEFHIYEKAGKAAIKATPIE